MSGFYTWSRTASANASADNAVNWAEGMAPSAVNDSGGGMMASTAKWRDDISGSLATSGSSTAYTLASYQGFDTLGHLDGQQIAFTPHVTNGATVTLAVDGLGGKPLRSAPGVELPAAVLIAGSPYVATYYNATGEFILQGFYAARSHPRRRLHSVSWHNSSEQQFCIPVRTDFLAHRLCQTVRARRHNVRAR
jgi:hypothetical protein